MATDAQIYLSQRHRSLAGVCAGIALARGYSVSLTRTVTILLACLSGLGALAYLVAWIVFPRAQRGQEPEVLPSDPFQRVREGRRIAGVCGGVARALNVDANAVRFVWALVTLFYGVGLVPYLFAWVVVPEERAPILV